MRSAAELTWDKLLQPMRTVGVFRSPSNPGLHPGESGAGSVMQQSRYAIIALAQISENALPKSFVVLQQISVTLSNTTYWDASGRVLGSDWVEDVEHGRSSSKGKRRGKPPLGRLLPKAIHTAARFADLLL